MSCPSQSPSASRSCCRGSLTCIPPELGDASFGVVVAGCQCRQPSGQSSCPVPSATMSLTAAATSPSAWAAPTRCVRPAYTNCTAKPAPSTRRRSARTSICCRSTAPCCSWLELRWVQKDEGTFVWNYRSEYKLTIFPSFHVLMYCVCYGACLLGPKSAAGEPEQCSRGGTLWGLQGVCRRAGSLLKTYQRNKRWCLHVCVCAHKNLRSVDICVSKLSSSHSVCGGCSWAACVTWQSCSSHFGWRLKASVLLWYWGKNHLSS